MGQVLPRFQLEEARSFGQSVDISTFKKLIWSHYKRHGRHDLPWRRTANPYRILVSEIMLQQTQVDRVIPKYKNFIKQFPNFKKLAQAPLKKVLLGWQGLGYNRRALNLKRTAEIVVKKYDGKLPRTEKELVALPGIGPYTAGAIVAFAYNKPAVFLETNIRAVFIHHYFPPRASKLPKKIHDKELLPLIEKTLDRNSPREWYAALMDYGTHLKKNTLNPNQKSAHYTKQSAFKGSNRELRGKILKTLLGGTHTPASLINILGMPQGKINAALKQLERDGLIQATRRRIRVA